MGATAPIYYGEYKEPVSGETWLVIEYVEGLRLNKAAPESMAEAARWIGRLHAASEALVPEPALYVKTYTSDYYLGWARRTALYTRHLGPELSWVRTVCERASDSFSHLLSSPPVVVHGEYYPENILVRTGAILPVDWQSAAIGAGEIDLASLTEGRWDAEVVRECVEAYRDVRWPDGAPPNFEKTLTAARLYWPLRWLGDKPEWTVEESRRPYFGELRSQAERLGII